MISVCFQGKPSNITVIQVYAPTSNAEETEVEQFYEDLQDLLELTPKRDVFFIIGDWNAKVGSQKNTRVTGKFGLGIQNESGKRLIEFSQENTRVIAHTLFRHKRKLYTWMEVCDIVQEAVIKIIPKKKKCKKAKWLSVHSSSGTLSIR